MRGVNSVFKRALASFLIAVLIATLLPFFPMRANAAAETTLSNFKVSKSTPELHDNITFSFDIDCPGDKDIADVQYSIFYGKYGTVGGGLQNPGKQISCSLGIDFYGSWEFANIYITFSDGQTVSFYNNNTATENSVNLDGNMIATDMSGARAVVANTPSNDDSAPVIDIDSFTASQTEVELGNTASMYVSINDESGVADAQVTVIRGRGGSCGSSFVYDSNSNRWSTWVDGEFTGLYEIQCITVTDYCGNKQTYYNNQCSTYSNETNAIDMSGANVMVTGGDADDTEAPVIDVKSFQTDKQMVGLNEHFCITFKVTDNVAVNHVETSVKEGKGYICGCATWYNPATQTATIDLTGYFYGLWVIQYIYATDANGNTAYFYNTAYEEFDEANAYQMTQQGDASVANVYVGLSDDDTKTFISGDGMDNDVSLEITEDELSGDEYEQLIEAGYSPDYFYHLRGHGTYFGSGHRCWIWFWIPFSIDGEWYRIRHLLSNGTIQTENVQAYGHWVKIYVWEFSPFLIESTEDHSAAKEAADSSTKEETIENSDKKGTSDNSSSASATTSSASSGTVVPMVVNSQPAYNATVSATSNGNRGVKSEKVKTSDNGTAKILSVKSDKKTVVIGSTVEVDGVSYKVKTIGKGTLAKCTNVRTLTIPKSVTKIEKGAFAGAENLKVIKLKITKSITVEKGAFDGVDTQKMMIKVSKQMSDSQLEKLQNTLTVAGYKGKVKRVL